MSFKQWKLITYIVAIVLPVSTGMFISVVMIELDFWYVTAVLVGQVGSVLLVQWFDLEKEK